MNLRLAVPTDAAAMAELDQNCFTMPWSKQSFLADLLDVDKAYYVVLVEENRLIAYGGFWRICEEAQIMNIAVAPDQRRRGLASMILTELVRKAKSECLLTMTLEVRPSNYAARKLYESFAFKEHALRKHYYTDNGEDAIIMLKKLEENDI